MKTHPINYAFIDYESAISTIKSFKWSRDWNKFRVYIKQKYNIANAYVFIEYNETNIGLYEELQSAGFTSIFKDSNEKSEDNCSV